MERRFFRLSEISQVSRLTEGDLMNLIDREKITLCAWFEGETLGAHLKPQGSANAGLGNLFGYKGVIALNRQSSKKLARGENAHITTGMILEPELITDWRNNHTLYQQYGKHHFGHIAHLTQMPTFEFWAYLNIGGVVDLETVNRRMESVPKDGGLLELALGISQSYQSQQLGATRVAIEPSQLRFDLQAIQKLLSRSNHLTTSKLTSRGTVTHPIKQIISRLIVTYPTARADVLWQQLRKEVNAGQSREFDRDSIIDEMSDSSIVWFGKDTDAERRTSYKTFRNWVSEARRQTQPK